VSMNVDFSKPLTDAERAYLHGRGKYADIERADNINGVTDPPPPGAGDGTGPVTTPLGTAEQRILEKERLLARLKELEGEEPDSDEEVADEPYEAWKPAELDKELKARNLTGGGTKGEKVARLYEDDERTAAAAAQS
jgi:hypothetical protein